MAYNGSVNHDDNGNAQQYPYGYGHENWNGESGWHGGYQHNGSHVFHPHRQDHMHHGYYQQNGVHPYMHHGYYQQNYVQEYPDDGYHQQNGAREYVQEYPDYNDHQNEIQEYPSYGYDPDNGYDPGNGYDQKNENHPHGKGYLGFGGQTEAWWSDEVDKPSEMDYEREVPVGNVKPVQHHQKHHTQTSEAQSNNAGNGMHQKNTGSKQRQRVRKNNQHEINHRVFHGHLTTAREKF
jgi:hypothetical protein